MQIALTNVLKRYWFKRKWRQQNRHNQTIPVSFFRIDKISVGKKTYGELNVMSYGNDTQLIIGSYCSIAKGVRFLLDSEHRLDCISTFPFKVMCFGHKEEALSKGSIVVGDDVWIGTDAIICAGISIGQGAVIATRSVVTKNVEPYAIVAGNPARTIRYRFDKQICEQLLETNLCDLFENIAPENIELLYSPINENNYKTLLSTLNVKAGST
ncbi:MAG: CatB-related O-acetyltransferase [Tannerellaceae bacterium]|jgi:acetyltransferase-like isoleucine patch superfamily enzyme|nr:CatB-related O-acetyltransferase [Tannerellaceae bacterium]